MWQDGVLTIIGFLFAVFLIPLIIDSVHGKHVNKLSSFTTFMGLYIIAFTYLTIGLHMAMFTVTLTGVLWMSLFIMSVRDKK